MADPTLSDAGRGLLNRRRFLEHAGTGLGGIALASLLADEGLLAAERRADRRSARPSARRIRSRRGRRTSRPKAKRVLVIFCSGACSQLDTWDYKPELIKTARPAAARRTEKLVTFQGENGNLARAALRRSSRAGSAAR